MLSAETITDEQIIALRDEFEASRIAGDAAYSAAFRARTTSVTFGGRFATRASESRLVEIDSERTDAESNYHTTLSALGTRITWCGVRNTSAAERSDARARCAEIINARKAT